MQEKTPPSGWSLKIPFFKAYLPANFFKAFANLDTKRLAVFALIVRLLLAFAKADSACLKAFSASALSFFAIAARTFFTSVRTAFKLFEFTTSRFLLRLTRVLEDFKFAIFLTFCLDKKPFYGSHYSKILPKSQVPFFRGSFDLNGIESD